MASSTEAALREASIDEENKDKEIDFDMLETVFKQQRIYLVRDNTDVLYSKILSIDLYKFLSRYDFKF